MTWPLEPQGIARFAQGLEDIIVVEEKRAFIERQMKEQFFNWPASWAILGAAEALSEAVAAGALDKIGAEAELQRLIVATVKRR